MTAAIVDNRIAGTRITVWTITHYLEGGDWTLEQIADVLNLSLEQVQAAVDYIEANAEEVWKVHRQIEERNARGNPPEIEKMLEESHARILAWIDESKKNKKCEANGEGNHSGR
jgi:uncharacterized protein (DUF433 family)